VRSRKKPFFNPLYSAAFEITKLDFRWNGRPTEIKIMGFPNNTFSTQEVENKDLKQSNHEQNSSTKIIFEYYNLW
jgi:glutathione peroxidase-family protein